MRQRRGTQNEIGSLRGWWKALPFLFLPFAVIFFEAWLHTQILQNQYKVNGLSGEIRQLEERLHSLREAHHRLGRIERMTAKAPDLALVAPKPGQIMVIRPEAAALASLPTSTVLLRKKGRSFASEQSASRPAPLLMEASSVGRPGLFEGFFAWLEHWER